MSNHITHRVVPDVSGRVSDSPLVTPLVSPSVLYTAQQVYMHYDTFYPPRGRVFAEDLQGFEAPPDTVDPVDCWTALLKLPCKMPKRR
ncbi:predicted protein [Sclerotinia sclerotiorum 1980 UF-70]|uniref:Uncharacterized protein n=1 Tax=Sclerotinia sclerotiorum (strain ATCC 18683 / 1980 / Ss-1) TaxID=665079 RepID=A7EGP2_SCLS1|nr:predicted protein [Sclerotinia sclerotiorum 1980 UF-70]EDO02008.1 predicted protein [Sclerotinia sclerotiorum 1980 UF-70]